MQTQREHDSALCTHASLTHATFKEVYSTSRYLLQGYEAEILWSEPALGAAYSAKQANKKPLHAQICNAEWFLLFSCFISTYEHLYIYTDLIYKRI